MFFKFKLWSDLLHSTTNPRTAHLINNRANKYMFSHRIIILVDG